VPGGSGKLKFDSGNGGSDDISGNEEEVGLPVTLGDVKPAGETGTVEFEIVNGAETGPDV
jgi:hypothetical protein